jgi:hypothetical protein
VLLDHAPAGARLAGRDHEAIIGTGALPERGVFRVISPWWHPW